MTPEFYYYVGILVKIILVVIGFPFAVGLAFVLYVLGQFFWYALSTAVLDWWDEKIGR